MESDTESSHAILIGVSHLCSQLICSGFGRDRPCQATTLQALKLPAKPATWPSLGGVSMLQIRHGIQFVSVKRIRFMCPGDVMMAERDFTSGE